MPLLGRSDNEIRIGLTSKSDTKAIDKTARSIDNLDNSTGRMGKSSKALSAVAAKGKIAIAALAATTVAATAASIKSAASFEQTRTGLENMLGSADKARKILADVSDFAAETPFEFPELADATKQLIAFGFSGDSAFKTMKQLGDVSSAIGAPIGDLAYLMGTLKTQGRAFTIDIRQFAQRGIPIYEYLAKTLGKTTAQVNEMVTAGKIGFPEVQKAFEAMTAEGGKFHGTMEKQSKTLSGQWSTLTDNLGILGRELVGINKQGDIKDGSIFQFLTEVTGEVNKGLDELNQSFDEAPPKMSRYAQLSKELGVSISQNANVYEHLKQAVKDSGQMIEVAEKRAKVATDEHTRSVNASKTAADNLTKARENVRLAEEKYGQNSPQYRKAVAEATSASDAYWRSLKVQTERLLKNKDALFTVKQAHDANNSAVRGAEAAGRIGRGAWEKDLTVVNRLGDGALNAGKKVDILNSKIARVVKAWSSANVIIQTQSQQLNNTLFYTEANANATLQRITNQALNTGRAIQGAGSLQGGAGVQGSKRATGGSVSGGRIYRINENEEEYFQPNGSGTILTTRQLQSNGMVSPSNSPSIQIHNLNVYPQTAEASRAIFEELDQDTRLSSRGFAPARGGA